MAVVYVKMMSGWESESDSLKSLLKDKQVGVRRYDVEKNGDVQLYFSKVSEPIDIVSGVNISMSMVPMIIPSTTRSPERSYASALR